MKYSKELYEKYMKPWREEHREEWSDYNKRLRRRQRRAVLELLGGRCVVCNRDSSKTKLIVHERHGRPHGASYVAMLDHLDDYIVICLPHHSSVHRWKNEGTIEALIKVLKDLM